MNRFTKSKNNRFPILWVIFILPALASSRPAVAINFQVAGRPGMFMGYLNQGAQFGIAGDHYDTRSGFQAAILQLLLEVNYAPSPRLGMFVSTNVNVDWAYPILQSDTRWTEREFDKSKDNLFVLDDYETILKEAHVTWAPGNFIFRLGKQIVAWGETDGIRLMDQINPLDTRRGISDVEFETTIIPIWLLKAEYYLTSRPTWVQDLGLEFVFNFNADFIADKSFATGNNVYGIWAANVPAGDFYDLTSLGLPGLAYLPTDVISEFPPLLQPLFNALLSRFPILPGRLGAVNAIIDEPKAWDPDYFEYGLRLKTVIQDTIITLNGFYGRANSPVTVGVPKLPEIRVASDGVLIVEPTVQGFFPLFRFAGFTLTRDFPKLYLEALGGVAPVLRVEALYAFDSTFASYGKVGLLDQLTGQTEEFGQHDEIRYAIGVDWKVKIRWLNPRDGFRISPQFIQRHVCGFPSDYGLMDAGGLPVEENNYYATLMVQTTYFHNKLVPTVFWQRSWQGALTGDLIIAQLGYERSYHWNYTVQAVWAEGDGLAPLDHKDNISVTVAYRF